MKALVKRTVTALLLAALVTPGLSAAVCANYISSGGGDAPLTGSLLGERTVTTTTTRSFGTTGGFKTVTGSTSYSSTTTISYSVGVYEMSDGTRIELRCDTYQVA